MGEKMTQLTRYQCPKFTCSCCSILKINNTIKKMCGRPKQTFLQKIHMAGQEALKKMFNITNYLRNANQNCNE